MLLPRYARAIHLLSSHTYIARANCRAELSSAKIVFVSQAAAAAAFICTQTDVHVYIHIYSLIYACAKRDIHAEFTSTRADIIKPDARSEAKR